MRYGFSESDVPPNSAQFGRTVPPNSVLFSTTVTPNHFPSKTMVIFNQQDLPSRMSTDRKLGF